MDLGANFAAKLEPFLLMAKSAKGAGAAKLIQDATSAPGVFVFSELLEMPNIQELAKSEQHQKMYALLELFSYKTFQDYIQNQDQYPPLNAAQTTKLKHLTIVTLASERRILPYADLLQALQMPGIRELEDLIIDAIYLDVLRGKLDQKESQLEVEYTMGRDLASGKLESVLAALQNWASTTSDVLSTLDRKIADLAQNAVAAQARAAQHEREVQATLKEVSDKQAKEKAAASSGRGSKVPAYPVYSPDRMDVDSESPLMEVQSQTKARNRKVDRDRDMKSPQRAKRNRF